jgi:hypothetical protein
MIVFFIILSIFLFYYYYIKIIRNKEHLTINEECNKCYNTLSNDLVNKILLNMNQKLDDNSNKIKKLIKETNKIPYLESEINEYNKIFSNEKIEEDNNKSLTMNYTNF